MPELSDIDVNRLVRRVLVKHWVDLGRMSVRTTRGHVTLSGRLQRIHGAEHLLTGPAVDSMFSEIRRIPSVGRVSAHFENWSNDGGLWHAVEVAAGDDSIKGGGTVTLEASDGGSE